MEWKTVTFVLKYEAMGKVKVIITKGVFIRVFLRGSWTREDSERVNGVETSRGKEGRSDWSHRRSGASYSEHSYMAHLTRTWWGDILKFVHCIVARVGLYIRQGYRLPVARSLPLRCV